LGSLYEPVEISPDIAYLIPAPNGLNGFTIESIGNSFLKGVYEFPEESVLVISAPVTTTLSTNEFILYSIVQYWSKVADTDCSRAFLAVEVKGIIRPHPVIGTRSNVAVSLF